MKFQFLTRVNKYKGFHFTPRFYDARKEDLDRRIKQHQTDQDAERDEHFIDNKKEELRDSIARSWGRTELRMKQKKSSNVRVVLIILALFTLGYFIFSKEKTIEKPIIHKID